MLVYIYVFILICVFDDVILFQLKLVFFKLWKMMGYDGFCILVLREGFIDLIYYMIVYVFCNRLNIQIVFEEVELC